MKHIRHKPVKIVEDLRAFKLEPLVPLRGLPKLFESLPVLFFNPLPPLEYVRKLIVKSC